MGRYQLLLKLGWKFELTMKDLLNSLARATALEFEQATSMPPQIYYSIDLLDLEIEEIFRKEWICIGRTAEIPNTGDYLTFEFLDQSVIAIRQKDASIKVFANVCAHRCTKLLEDRGNSGRIVCPYHAWTYRTDGQLIAAPYMDQTPGFDVKDYRLKEVRWEVWQGYIYITLNQDAVSVSERLAGFEKVIGRYQIENYIHAFTCDAIWPANWKCFVENYMDAYHIFKVHKDTFGKYGSAEEVTTMYDGDDNFTYHLVDIGAQTHNTSDSGAGVAHPDNKHLDGSWRTLTVLGCVFPAHTMQLQPDMLWYVTVQPHGVGHFRMRWSVSIPPEIMNGIDNPEQYIEETRELLIAVNTEDEGIIRRVFQGARSSQATPGPYAYLERNVFRFGQYLARRLTK